MDIEAWCAGEDGMTVECMAETIREGHETGSDNGYTWCLAAEMTDDDAGLAGMISGRLEFSPCPSDDEWWDLLYACLSRPELSAARAVTLRAFLALVGKHPDDVLVPDEGGLLAFCASFGQPDAVDMLLRAGASVHGGSDGAVPLERLVAGMNGDAGRLLTARLLLDAGASPVGRDGNPLWESCPDEPTAALLKGAWEAREFGTEALPGVSGSGRRGP